MFIKMDHFADSDTTSILDADSLLLLEQAVTLEVCYNSCFFGALSAFSRGSLPFCLGLVKASLLF